MVFVRSRLNPKTYGHFGEMLDAVTGLLYVGNGQYYAPATGRFLAGGIPEQRQSLRAVESDWRDRWSAGGYLLPFIGIRPRFCLHKDGSLLILLMLCHAVFFFLRKPQSYLPLDVAKGGMGQCVVLITFAPETGYAHFPALFV